MNYYEKSKSICESVLVAVVAAYEATSIELPARRVVGYAGMPLDCEQLAVIQQRVFSVDKETGPDGEGSAAHRCYPWRAADIDIIVLRCAPVPRLVRDQLQPIAPAELAAFTDLQLADPHIICRGVLDAWNAGNLGAGANIVLLDTAPVGDESGGLVGLRARIRVGLLIAL